jgi:hypothetical protein
LNIDFVSFYRQAIYKSHHADNKAPLEIFITFNALISSKSSNTSCWLEMILKTEIPKEKFLTFLLVGKWEILLMLRKN